MTRSHHAPSRPVIGGHRIADLRQDEKGPCHTTCECGVTVRGARPETTAELFAEHRKSVGAPTRQPSDVLRSGGPDPYRTPRKRPRVGRSVPAEWWPTW